jgi:hypothetical protein
LTWDTCKAGDAALFAAQGIRLQAIADTTQRCAFIIRGLVDLDKETIEDEEDELGSFEGCSGVAAR